MTNYNFKPIGVIIYETPNDKTTRWEMRFATVSERDKWIEDARKENPQRDFRI